MTRKSSTPKPKPKARKLKLKKKTIKDLNTSAEVKGGVLVRTVRCYTNQCETQ